MAVERRLYHPALDAAPAPVDDADLAEPGLRSGGHVFLNDGDDVAWRERVEIELGLDGDVGHVRPVGMVRHAGIRP